MKEKLEKWFDEFGLAMRGFLLASKSKSFLISFLLTFLVFGMFINLLSNGFGSFRLMFAGDLKNALSILSGAFLNIFGVNKNFLDWFLNFVLTLLQSALISLVIFISKHNRAEKKREKADNGVESSALVAGLVVLGSGCPTCGTTLLTPLLGTILSGASGSVALAGKLSLGLNFLALLLGTFVFKKLGFMTYAIIKSEEYMKKKEKSHAENS
ncbi:hypothetical protein IJ380_02950 [Candidatus Saccharibacteria bacterium]|nr:hypothetical protein [Candidatus Saccharibacteria bacterium]